MRIGVDRRQADSHDCGPTSAAVVLDCLGLAPQESARLAALMPCSVVYGTDPATAEAFFRSVGFRVQAGEMAVGDLVHHCKLRRPVLCVIQREGYGHWITVNRATAKAVGFHCPIDGKRVLTASAFRRLWWDWDRRGSIYPGFGLAVWRTGKK